MSQPNVDLEQELEKLSPDLWENLEQIKRAAQRIWGTVKLRWFSDHGPTHSRAIVEHIGDIVKPLYLQERQPFGEHELFVLLAACYLHDIGMQDFRFEGRTSVDLTAEDFNLVRKRHPARSAEIIRGGVIDLGGKDGIVPLGLDRDYLEAVMIISEAHGTDYFAKALAELEANPPAPRNQLIRGPLLASLLMMGDELDLHESRVRDCLSWPVFKMEDFPPESLLHIFKHHYITLVEVINDRSHERQISLRFQFPQDSANYADDIEAWVVTKLRQQCQVTQDILRSAGLSWARKLAVQRVPDARHVRDPLPEVAMPYLERETHERQLVNRDELIAKLKEYLTSAPPGREALIAWGTSGSDLEYIVNWLLAACACCPDIILCHQDFDPNESHGQDHIQSETESLLAPGTRGVLILSNLQHAQIDTQHWLWTEWLPEVVEPVEGRQNTAIIFIEDGAPEPSDTPLTLHSFQLRPFDESQVTNHLTYKYGCSSNWARDLALAMNPARLTPCEVIGHIRFLLNKGALSWTWTR